jgi:glycosyltransferase involved in cell wall biosynthesis
VKDLLFVSPINPFAPDNGAAIRVASLLEALVDNWRVTMLCLSVPSKPKEPPAQLKAKLSELFLLPNGRSRKAARLRWAIGSMPYRYYLIDFRSAAGYGAAIASIRRMRFDRIMCNFQESLPVLKDLGANPAISWLDTQNWDRDWCQSFIASKSMGQRYYGSVELRRRTKFESQFFGYAKNVTHVSAEDRASAVSVFPGHRHEVIPNGVAGRFFDAGARLADRPSTDRTSRSVLFVGSLDVEMNIGGVEWLVNEVWPHVRSQNPGLKLHLVGRNPNPRVTRLQSKDVILFGNVADVMPHYENAGCIVVPGFVGGGSKLKVLEALATGLPIVSTRFGVVGLPDSICERVQIEDDPVRFAAGVLETHNRPTVVPKSVLKEFRWTAVGSKLDALLRSDIYT